MIDNQLDHQIDLLCEIAYELGYDMARGAKGEKWKFKDEEISGVIETGSISEYAEFITESDEFYEQYGKKISEDLKKLQSIYGFDYEQALHYYWNIILCWIKGYSKYIYERMSKVCPEKLKEVEI
jgi:hypothetical protein